MKAALEKFLGIEIEKLPRPLNIFNIESQIRANYGQIYDEIEDKLRYVIRVIPVYLLFQIESDLGIGSLEHPLIFELPRLKQGLKPSHLKDDLLQLIPYIHLRFLVDHLQLYALRINECADICSDDLIKNIILELNEIENLQLDNDFLLNEIYRAILNIVVLRVRKHDDFKRYQNLICFFCNIHPKGDSITKYLMDILYSNIPDLNFIKAVIGNLKSPVIVDAAKSTFKPLKRECQKILVTKEQEVEFALAKKEAIDLVAIIKIFQLYTNNDYCRITPLFFLNIGKALECFYQKILDRNWPEMELYLLFSELKTQGNFWRFVTKYSGRVRIAQLLEFIEVIDDLEHKDDVAIQVKQYDQFENQSKRLARITKISEEDLAKVGEEFAIVLSANRQQRDDMSVLFINLCLLSNQQYFQALSKDQQLDIIKSFLSSYSGLFIGSEDMVSALAYCLAQSLIILVDLMADDAVSNQKLAQESIRDILFYINKSSFALKYLIDNDELPPIQQEIYQRFAKQIKETLDAPRFAKQSFLLDTIALDLQDGLRFFIKELYDQHENNLARLEEIFKSLRDLKFEIMVMNNPIKIYNAKLDQAITELALCRKPILNVAGAIYFLRQIVEPKGGYFLPSLVKKTLLDVKSVFIRDIKDQRWSSAIIKEIELQIKRQNQHFLKFFMEQQEMMDSLSSFLQSQKRIDLVSAMLNLYHGVISPDSTSDQELKLWEQSFLPKTAESKLPPESQAFAEELSLANDEKKQMKADIEFLKLQLEEKLKELEQGAKKLKRYESLLSGNKKQITSLQSEAADLRGQNEEQETLCQELRSQNLELTKHLSALMPQIQDATAEERRYLADGKLKDEKISELSKQCKKLKAEIKILTAKIQDAEKQLIEQQKHHEVEDLSAENIATRLDSKGQEILTKVQMEFGNVIMILQQNLSTLSIEFERLEIIGSQVYVPLLKMLNDRNIIFKDDGEPCDLDLCLVLDDKDFDRELPEELMVRNCLSLLLPEFKIVAVNSAAAPKKSTSVKLLFGNCEVDLNIYGKSDYPNLSQWQFNADRIKFVFEPKIARSWQFKINNNQVSVPNNYEDCQTFLLGLKSGAIDLWQANNCARGFLNRILKDCGRLKLTPAVLQPIKQQLMEEMATIYCNWEWFRSRHCSKLVANNKKDELAMVQNIHYIYELHMRMAQMTSKMLPSNTIAPYWVGYNAACQSFYQ